VGGEYRSLSSSLWSFLSSPITSSLLSPNILKHPQPTSFPQCQRPQVSHPYKNNRQNYSSVHLNLWRRSTAARLMRSWVRIPPGSWIFVYCVCCVLSGTGLCDELITRPQESYRLWRVVGVIKKPRDTRKP
jgi:hypothetical protein